MTLQLAERQSARTGSVAEPMVTVILAVRDGGIRLHRAMDSVLEQSLSKLRMIVVDDYSFDCTALTLQEYAHADGRVSVLTNDAPSGLTRSLNRALGHVSTPWVARIDHDDIWCREKLERQMAFVNDNPDVGLLGTAYQEIYGVAGEKRETVVRLVTSDEEIRDALYQFNPFFHSSVLIRTDLVRQVGGYNAEFRYAQDYELWARIAAVTRMAILPDILCYRGMDAENISIRKERAQRVHGIRAKWTWVKTNGFRKALVGSLVRDLIVVLAPTTFKRMIRYYVHRMRRFP